MNRRTVEGLRLAVMDKALVKSAAKTGGRLDGEHACPVCGMKAWTLEDANECCRGAPLISDRQDGRRRGSRRGPRLRYRILDKPGLRSALREKMAELDCDMTNLARSVGLHEKAVSNIFRLPVKYVENEAHAALFDLFKGDMPWIANEPK